MFYASETSDFKALQRQFAAHIRDPQVPVIEGIEDRRMKIYRDLFFNNVNNFTTIAFPVAFSIMGETWWHAAVRDFLRDYRCDSPYFHSISEAFLTFLTEVRGRTDDEPPFLHELMHYEWVELALEISESDPSQTASELTADLVAGHPVQSPLAWSLSYHYPVQQISADYQPSEVPDQPTWMMVHRDAQDRVKFTELNALTARLLYLLDQDEQLSGRAALAQIATELGQEDPTAIIEAGAQILTQFYDAGILLGARPLEE